MPGNIAGSPFGGIPRNWKPEVRKAIGSLWGDCSPFGGIPRNWKRSQSMTCPTLTSGCSPFGGIPRNWKPTNLANRNKSHSSRVPPSGGSLEIGNAPSCPGDHPGSPQVPPSGGSLEIGNFFTPCATTWSISWSAAPRRSRTGVRPSTHRRSRPASTASQSPAAARPASHFSARPQLPPHIHPLTVRGKHYEPQRRYREDHRHQGGEGY
jgi:hypothetical protein